MTALPLDVELHMLFAGAQAIVRGLGLVGVLLLIVLLWNRVASGEALPFFGDGE